MSIQEVNRIVAVGNQHANQVPAPGIFYSWGGDNHLALTLSGRDEALFSQRYNQPVGGGSNAGPGLYLSTNLYDSSDYCPGNNGVLLQVDMPDRIPFIDSSNHQTMNALRTGVPPVNGPMLYRNGADKPPILLKFTQTWLCLKTVRGVGFRKFDGRAHTAPQIQNALNELRRLNRHAAVNVLLGQLRADIRSQVH